MAYLTIPTEVQNAFWVVVAGALSIIGVYLGKIGSQLKKNGKVLDAQGVTLEKTHSQVANTHSTNLRDDLTTALDKLASFDEKFSSFDEKFSSLSDEMKDGFKRLDHQHGETKKEINTLHQSLINTRSELTADRSRLDGEVTGLDERLRKVESDSGF